MEPGLNVQSVDLLSSSYSQYGSPPPAPTMCLVFPSPDTLADSFLKQSLAKYKPLSCLTKVIQLVPYRAIICDSFLDGNTYSMDMRLSRLGDSEGREVCCAAVHGVPKSQTTERLNNKRQLLLIY